MVGNVLGSTLGGFITVGDVLNDGGINPDAQDGGGINSCE